MLMGPHRQDYPGTKGEVRLSVPTVWISRRQFAWVGKREGSRNNPRRCVAFHASIKLSEYRSVPGDGYDDLAEDVLRARDLQSMLAMRLVNRKWNDIVRKTFFSNILVFYKEDNDQSQGLRTKWYLAAGPNPNRYSFVESKLRYRLDSESPPPAAIITQENDLVYLQLSRDLGRFMIAPRQAIANLQQVNGYTFRDTGLMDSSSSRLPTSG
jgi:hypothetical protein